KIVAEAVTRREFLKAFKKSIWTKSFYKVIKRQSLYGKKPGKGAFDNIPFLFQRIDQYHDKWKHIRDKDNDQCCYSRCMRHFFPGSADFCIFHYASTSFFLVI